MSNFSVIAGVLAACVKDGAAGVLLAVQCFVLCVFLHIHTMADLFFTGSHHHSTTLLERGPGCVF